MKVHKRIAAGHVTIAVIIYDVLNCGLHNKVVDNFNFNFNFYNKR